MIADMYESKCVDRAISTMRMALGYENGLPYKFPFGISIEGRAIPQVITMFDRSFPEREICIWCSVAEWELAIVSNSKYMGTFAKCSDVCNLYLYAFTYHGGGKGHIVVGWPVAYGDMSIGLIVGVKI